MRRDAEAANWISPAALGVSIFALIVSGVSAYYTYRSDSRAELATYPRVDWEVRRPEPRSFSVVVKITNTEYGQIRLIKIASRLPNIMVIQREGMPFGGSNELNLDEVVNNGETRTLRIRGEIDPVGAAYTPSAYRFELEIEGGSLPKSPFLFSVERTL